MKQNIAVLLSGCGFLDGAEIRESILTLLALDTLGANYTLLSLNKDQHHVVDHLKGESTTEKPRNMLKEAARIARGQIVDLQNADPKDFSGLIFPGGFGVAKNFCTFAFKGSAAEVDPIVKSFTTHFFAAKKPIGGICIAPAMLSLLFGSQKIEITIGQDKETAQEIEKTGAKHIYKEVNEIHVDEQHHIVTTPAYMFDQAPLNKINEGIYSCVKQVIDWQK